MDEKAMEAKADWYPVESLLGILGSKGKVQGHLGGQRCSSVQLCDLCPSHSLQVLYGGLDVLARMI